MWIPDGNDYRNWISKNRNRKNRRMKAINHNFNYIQEYALDENGNPIHINQIDESHNGLACNCTCPICGERLIARKGHGGKTPHFAHQQNSPCTHPEYIKQSNIHAMAEQIFLEEKEIELPSLSMLAGNYIAHFFTGGKWQIEEVALEKRISDFIPDIILKKDGDILLVEIYVTHAVDEDKRKKIVEANLPVIEIDLSEFVHDDMAKEDLRERLREKSRMKWIHLPGAVPLIQNFTKSKQVFSIQNTDRIIRECPQIRFGKSLSKNMCEKCQFCVGKQADTVECIYVFRYSQYWGKCQYPVLTPVKVDFDPSFPPISIVVAPIFTPRASTSAQRRPGVSFYQKEPSYQKRKSFDNRYNSRRGKPRR